MRELLRRGADIDARDADGRTAAMQAVIRGDSGTARMLQELGADCDVRDSRGRSAGEAVEEAMSSAEGWRPIFVRQQ